MDRRPTDDAEKQPRRLRLARELAKLDPAEEQALAEEDLGCGISGETAP